MGACSAAAAPPSHSLLPGYPMSQHYPGQQQPRPGAAGQPRPPNVTIPAAALSMQQYNAMHQYNAMLNPLVSNTATLFTH